MVETKNNYSLLIQKLDEFIRKYYVNQMIKGALYSLGMIIFLFVVFTVLEYFYYFSQSGRKTLFFSFIGVSGLVLFFGVILPLIKYFKLGKTISHEQAAVIVGEHFVDVKDKLLNVLQLKAQSSTATSDLIEASINQKSESIRLVPFKKAIDLTNNKRHLRYFIPPLLLLLAILFGSPSVITDSTFRIINNDKDFEKAAPFYFKIAEKELSILENEDFDLDVEVEGSILPDEVFINIEDYQYRLEKKSRNTFSYTFKNVHKNQKFNLFSGKVESKDHELIMLPKPALLDFTVDLDYPAYTQRKDESIENIGDLTIPAGTQVRWSMHTANTDDLSIRFQNTGTITKVEREGKDLYKFKHRLMNDDRYTMHISNANMPMGDSVGYFINVIPDLYPEINAKLHEDSLQQEIQYFVGNTSDDYGLSKLTFNYQVLDENGILQSSIVEPLPLKKGNSEAFSYLFDISELKLGPGHQVNYYFESFDNDAVHGSKSTKTTVLNYAKPTIDELEKLEDENEEEIKAKLEDSLKESEKIREELKKLREKLLQEKTLEWQDKKELEKLLERQRELQEEMKKAQEKMKENLKNQNEMQKDSEMKEKLEKLNEMMEESMDTEMQDLMEKIQELMEELDKDQAMEMMKEMEKKDQAIEKDMDRLLELYKQLEVEKEIQEVIEKLEEMAEKQEKLSEESKKEESKAEDIEKKQEELNKEFEELQKEMEELEKKNEELEYPKEMGDDNEEEMKDIEKEMEDSQEQLQQENKGKASKSQKSASDKMKSMAGNLQSSMMEGAADQAEEDLKALRQLLENIVGLSFDQEELVNEFAATSTTTPRYVALVKDQFKIQNDFQLVEDSLQELSKRVSQIESFVIDKVSEINYNLEEGIEKLEDRRKPEASQHQRFAMKNLNDLALMLAESMDQMQQQMAGMMPGSQMCNKPGGKGQGKDGKVPMDKISEGQKELGEQMQKMMDGKGKGGKPGEGGDAKEFAEAAKKQAELRKALEAMQQKNGEDGKGMSKELQEAIEQMNENEIDFVNKRLNAEMLKRQSNIETRLLEAEKAEREREYDNKRKGETAVAIERKFPPSLADYIKQREAEIDMYKSVSPTLKPYYKQLVEEYYKKLKNGE